VARFGIILFLLLLVVGFVIRQLSRQGTSPRFRFVVLGLGGLLLVLAGLGVYSTWRQPQSSLPQTEFAAQRSEILETIEQRLEAGKYDDAYDFARRYRDVQDPALEKLLRRAHEQTLLARIESLPETQPGRIAELYAQLTDIAPDKGYADKAAQWRLQAKRQEQKALQEALAELPPDQHPARWLVYRRLSQLAPEEAVFAKREEEIGQALTHLVQESPWSDACSSSAIRACRFKGFTAFDPVASEPLGSIIGVAWRPKGALIDVESGLTAPENAHYYIVLPQAGPLVLAKTSQTETELPEPLQPWRDRLVPDDRYPVAE